MGCQVNSWIAFQKSFHQGRCRRPVSGTLLFTGCCGWGGKQLPHAVCANGWSSHEAQGIQWASLDPYKNCSVKCTLWHAPDMSHYYQHVRSKSGIQPGTSRVASWCGQRRGQNQQQRAYLSITGQLGTLDPKAHDYLQRLGPEKWALYSTSAQCAPMYSHNTSSRVEANPSPIPNCNVNPGSACNPDLCRSPPTLRSCLRGVSHRMISWTKQ